MVQVFLLKLSQQILPEGDTQHGKIQPKQLNVGNIISNRKQSYNGKYCTAFHIGGNAIQTARTVVNNNNKSHKKAEVTSKLNAFLKSTLCNACEYSSLPAPMPKPALQSRGSRSRSPLPEISAKYTRTDCFRIMPSCDSHRDAGVSLS